MLTKEAIEQIQETAGKTEVIEVDGFKFLLTPSHINAKKVSPADPNPLHVSSLQGVVGFLDHYTEIIENKNDLMVHISNYKKVYIVSDLDPLHMTRRHYLIAEAHTNKYPFGCFLSTEEFIIEVMSNFMETDDQKILLSFVGAMKADSIRQENDDGFSQNVIIKTGIASVSEKKVPNPIHLRPYVTFSDINQPRNGYIFRVQKGNEKNQSIKCALFEIKSNFWQIDVCNQIHDFIKNAAPKVAIIS